MEPIEDLIKKYNAGQCTVEEKLWLEQWYQSFDLNRNEKKASRDEMERLKEEAWQILQKKMNSQPIATPAGLKQRQFNWWLYAAAAIFLAVIGGFGVYIFQQDQNIERTTSAPQNKEAMKDIVPGSRKAQLVLGDGSIISLDSAKTMQLTEKDGTDIDKVSGRLVYNSGAGNGAILFNTLTTPRGGEYQLVLPDGSKVWLNASSSLKFPTRFDGSSRTVFLNGEAYFEVARNEKMPFHVKLNDGMDVEVLGTHFNIMGYDDESEIKTTLAEGRVKVSKESVTVFLTPAKQAVLNKSEKSLVVNNADVSKELAWKNGMIEFNGEDLHYIMRQLSRWYDVDIYFERQIPKGRYEGAIRREAPLSKVLEILKLAGVEFKMENRKILITGG